MPQLQDRRAGRAGAERDEEYLRYRADAEPAVRDVAELRAGTVRVAAFATAGRSFAVAAMTAFRHRHPDVELHFSELESDESLPLVRAGEIDLAVTHEYTPLSRPDLRGLTQRSLCRERCLADTLARAKV